MELSIVMPCLNEVRTLPVCIKKALSFLETHGINGEVIVADNGSTDGSVEAARELGARVVPVQTRGYGAALSAGIHAASGKYIVMGDSDDSYDFLALAPFIEQLRNGYDLVMGNRFKGGIAPKAMPPMHRYFGNPLLTIVGRRIYSHDVCGDFYCGLRGFRKDAIEALDIQSTGMEFALEMIIKAELYGLKITEVPTTLSPDGRDRKPHLRTYRDGWRSLRLYLMMSPRWTFGFPGAVCIIFGGSLFLSSLLGFAPRGDVIGPLIFSSAAVISGYQALLLAVFAKLIAVEVGLHPKPTRLRKLTESSLLEWFLVVGMVIVLAGILLACGILLNPPRAILGKSPSALHIQCAVLAAVSMVVGAQTMIAGLYFGILRLVSQRRLYPRKRRSDTAPVSGEDREAAQGRA